MSKISIIVPCYNEEECIELYYNEMQKIVEQLETEFEYIFVNDGSKDKTLSIMRSLAQKDPNVKYVSFSRNFGKEAAMYAGLKAATGDYVGLMDVDLQDPPHLLLEMYNGIVNEGYDCVASRRTTRKGEPPIRSFFARRFYKLINKISDANITDGARDYRLMTRTMVDAILSLEEKDRFSKGIFGWVGFNIKWLEYENVDRVAGTTKWSFKKLWKYAIGGIQDFSTAPLAISKFMSIMTFLGFLGLIASIFICEWTNTFYNFNVLFLSSMLCLMTSIICACLGVMSSYLRKIYKESKNRPVFSVGETNTIVK